MFHCLFLKCIRIATLQSKSYLKVYNKNNNFYLTFTILHAIIFILAISSIIKLYCYSLIYLFSIMKYVYLALLHLLLFLLIFLLKISWKHIKRHKIVTLKNKTVIWLLSNLLAESTGNNSVFTELNQELYLINLNINIKNH